MVESMDHGASKLKEYVDEENLRTHKIPYQIFWGKMNDYLMNRLEEEDIIFGIANRSAWEFVLTYYEKNIYVITSADNFKKLRSDVRKGKGAENYILTMIDVLNGHLPVEQITMEGYDTVTLDETGQDIKTVKDIISVIGADIADISQIGLIVFDKKQTEILSVDYVVMDRQMNYHYMASLSHLLGNNVSDFQEIIDEKAPEINFSDDSLTDDGKKRKTKETEQELEYLYDDIEEKDGTND